MAACNKLYTLWVTAEIAWLVLSCGISGCPFLIQQSVLSVHNARIGSRHGTSRCSVSACFGTICGPVRYFSIIPKHREGIQHAVSITLLWHLLLQPVDKKGKSGRSNDAVYLQEEVTLAYGCDNMSTKVYDMRRVILHLGTDSSSGHFTVAVRQQRDGRCQAGDKWEYLNSSAPSESYSLEELTARFCRNVVGVLLVAKTPPAFPEGPLPQPTNPLPPRRCASLSCMDLEHPHMQHQRCTFMSASLLTSGLLKARLHQMHKQVLS